MACLFLTKGVKMNLYQINTHIQQILDNGESLDRDTGEVLDDLDALDMDLKIKVENTIGFIKNTQAHANALKEQADAFTARAKVEQKKADRAQAYLTANAAGLSYDFPRTGKLTWRKSEQIEITDSSLITTEFTTTKTTINKAFIKATIKAGQEVQGAQIVEKQNAQIK